MSRRIKYRLNETESQRAVNEEAAMKIGMM